MRKKAPQIIFAAIALAVIIVVLLEILEDTFVQGKPTVGGPLQWLWSGIVLMTQNVTTAVSSWGYPGIFFLMLLESSSLPIPSEVVLPFAGYLVSTGQLNFWVCLTIATIAGIAGAIIDYYIGFKGAHLIAEHKIFGKTFFTKTQLELAIRWFGRFGVLAVFFSRLIPGFRTIVSFPAGAARMPLAKFIAYTTAGCLVWNGVLIYLGLFLGQNWNLVAGMLHYLIIAAAIILSVAVILLVIRWRRNMRKASTESSKT
jgi:membrane protein DedA with SNARE-associated domain